MQQVAYHVVQCPKCNKHQVTSAEILKCKYCNKSRKLRDPLGMPRLKIKATSYSPHEASLIVQKLNEK